MRALAALATALLVIANNSASQALTDADVLRRSQQVLANPEAFAGDDVAETTQRTLVQARERWADALEPIQPDANAVLDHSRKIAEQMAPGQMAATRADTPGHFGEPGDQPITALRYRLFVSQSMPLEELRGLAEMSASRGDMALVFRGLKPGQGFMALQKLIGEIVGSVSLDDRPMPTILIDPEPYKALGVELVPALAQYDDDDAMVGFVLGMTDPGWLSSMIDSGRTGNLGIYGPVSEMAEDDLMDVMMARAEAYDWEAAGERAVDRYFSRLPSINVPVATSHRVRRFDPTFEVTELIAAPDGTVIAAPGDRVNVLEHVPFNQTLVVFDPLDTDQVEAVTRFVANSRGGLITLVGTSLAKVDGFDDYSAMVNRIGAPVYLLQNDLRDRFHIEFVPTFITQDGLVFRIEERPPHMDKEETKDVASITPNW